MTPFATPAELRALLELPPLAEGETDARAELVLALASGAIRAEVGQVLSLVEDEDLTIEMIGRETVLPEFPVLEVSAATVDGTEALDDVICNRAGVLRLATFSILPRTVAVTYSHGYAPADLDAVKGVCLAAAARSYDNPTGERAESIGSVSATHSPDAPVVLTDAEKRALDPYRP